MSPLLQKYKKSGSPSQDIKLGTNTNFSSIAISETNMEHETEAGLMRESIQTIRKHDKVSQSKFNTFIPQ